MSTMSWKLVCFTMCLVQMSSSKRPRQLTDDDGFVSDCPGSTEPVHIPKTDLKYLGFVIQGPGAAINAKRIKYSYFQMKQLSVDPRLDFNRTTMLYIGGYMDSPNYPFAQILGTHYNNLNYNVLFLDWQKFTIVEYPQAARNSRAIGKLAAQMLANLTQTGLDPKKLELVGLSLGCQTAGFIGKHYYTLTGTKISRITAQDPSGPCFRNLGPNDRLDRSDADFVDVIDTNIDGFGMAEPIGDINFYVNGGEYQPSDVSWVPCGVLCSHIKSYLLWLVALEYPNSFIGFQCDTVQQARDNNCFDRVPLITNVLGLKTDRTKKGIFYLPTSNEYPYYVGKKGMNKSAAFYKRNLKLLKINPPFNEYIEG